MRSRTAAGLIVLVLGLVPARAAQAQQPERGPQITGIVGGSVFDDHVAHAEALTAGYRFSEVFGVEGGLERIPGLRFSERETGLLAQWIPASSNDGRALLIVGNAVFTLPIEFFGFTPYVLGGGGVAHLRQSIRFAVGGLDRDRAQIAPALTAGAGVERPVWRGLAIGVDVRYLHLFSEPFETVLPDRFAVPEPVAPLRFGTRVVYRF